MISDYDVNTSNNYTCHGITLREQLLFLSISPWIQGVAQISVSSVGVLTNCISIPVLCTKTMKSHMFNRLLVFLVLFDNLHLILALLDSIRLEFGPNLSTHQQHQKMFVYFLYPLQNINLTCNIYMTTVLGFERYLY